MGETEPPATESAEPKSVEGAPVVQTETTTVIPTEGGEQAEGAPAPKNWRENFTVREDTTVETVERLSVIVGANEYKGQTLVFIAKVTDKNFSRQFFSMPSWVWDKAIPIIQGYSARVGEIEKKAMAQRALAELKRLQELGVDVKGLLEKLE